MNITIPGDSNVKVPFLLRAAVTNLSLPWDMNVDTVETNTVGNDQNTASATPGKP